MHNFRINFPRFKVLNFFNVFIILFHEEELPETFMPLLYLILLLQIGNRYLIFL